LLKYSDWAIAVLTSKNARITKKMTFTFICIFPFEQRIRRVG
jgi:hypothetical protein